MKKNRNIFILGMVSLFTDLSSQMIYPLIPEFLVGLGASKSLIGIIEGIAEGTASLFRTVFGRLSDKWKKRKLFVALGYGLSTIAKPFLYLSASWSQVLAVRFIDRTGKGIRTPARDALISDSAPANKKGAAFGFHRAMDRLGAAGGPLLALLILYFAPGNLRLVFLLSAIPASIALIFIIFAKEIRPEKSVVPTKEEASFQFDGKFLLFLITVVIFTFGNSSNAFLILKAREVGVIPLLIPVVWLVYNLVSSASSPIFGRLSDRIGKKLVIAVSFIYYAVVYFFFGFSTTIAAVWILFGLYGIHYGLSEGVFRAHIADLVPSHKRATAYGMFNTAIGITLIPASMLTGYLWDAYSSSVALYTCAGFALAATVLFVGTNWIMKGSFPED
ncbi:MAG: MFS transporter [Candidatus Margulisbacteria bacterium]|nr:MFS transporter [Candidatus Margulisiibacteriota bacterium]MBU1021060.1 MFS transporter [Candidatus Margulisiibacteriota bacterium]MBU1729735.1 MFS transporter [Candidatus Margulisiibacteriota bacterium]MBU1956000.1 MFS transporter [Candidatus Margulisiibacteriota bacterium]